MSDKDIKEYAFDNVKTDFEMADCEDDKHKFFMENSEVVFVEGDMDTYDEEEVEKAIKSIDVKCIAFADQEDIEEKEYTLDIKVIGYDDNEYWSRTYEDFTVIVEEDDDEEELVTEEIINLITEECSLQISEQFIMENININMCL